MSGIVSIAIVWLGASIVMTGGWLYQRHTQNAGIVDVLWSTCMGAAALFYAATGSGALTPRVLVASLPSGVCASRRIFGSESAARTKTAAMPICVNAGTETNSNF